MPTKYASTTRIRDDVEKGGKLKDDNNSSSTTTRKQSKLTQPNAIVFAIHIQIFPFSHFHFHHKSICYALMFFLCFSSFSSSSSFSSYLYILVFHIVNNFIIIINGTRQVSKVGMEEILAFGEGGRGSNASSEMRTK